MILVSGARESNETRGRRALGAVAVVVLHTQCSEALIEYRPDLDQTLGLRPSV
jgi:hypothetical protein